jgi:hypothetical protein
MKNNKRRAQRNMKERLKNEYELNRVLLSCKESRTPLSNPSNMPAAATVSWPKFM